MWKNLYGACLVTSFSRAARRSRRRNEVTFSLSPIFELGMAASPRIRAGGRGYMYRMGKNLTGGWTLTSYLMGAILKDPVQFASLLPPVGVCEEVELC